MTFDVSIRRDLQSLPDAVYDVFADSTLLGQVRGVGVEVLEPGPGDGTGVLRRVSFGPGLFLLERVVDLDPSARVFDYLIEGSRPAFRHERGSITFEPHQGGTRATWTSTAGVSAGPLTRPVEAAARRGAGFAFGRVLDLIDDHLQKERA